MAPCRAGAERTGIDRAEKAAVALEYSACEEPTRRCEDDRTTVDERTYRGGVHPPYCTCVECTGRRNRARAGGRLAPLLRPMEWLRRLASLLRLRRS